MSFDFGGNTEGSLATGVLAASLASSALYFFKVNDIPHYSRMLAKTLSTTLLATTAAVSGGPATLTAALALGSVGDAFLSWDGETNFLGGLSSFLVAHLLYIKLFFDNSSGKALVVEDNVRLGLAGGMMTLAPSMIILLMPRVGRALQAPVFIYSATILVMVLTALSINNDQVITGAVLFAASDAILASGRFLVAPTSSHRSWMQPLVWVLYYSGQLLIALGMLKVL